MIHPYLYNENIKSYDLKTIYKYVEGNYNGLTLKAIKEYLKISKKIEKCKTDIFFINSCLQNNTLPNFTNFKTTNNRLRLQPIHSTCRKLLLTQELSNHNSDLHKLIKSIEKLKNNDLFHIPTNDLNSIFYVMDNEPLHHLRIKLRTKIIKKLEHININVTLNDINVNPAFITDRRDRSNSNSPKLVFDLSNTLDNKEINLLSKGLKFGIQNRNFNHFEILTRFEELAQGLKNEKIRDDFKDNRSIVTPIETFMQKLQHLAEDFVDSSKITQNSLTYDEELTLNNLKRKVKENDLIINKADKGNATVINNKSEYIKKVEQLFTNSKFEIITDDDPKRLEKMEESFNKNLLNISDEYTMKDEKNKQIKSSKIYDENDKPLVLKKGSINKQLYKQLFSSGAKYAVAYGVTKVHKKDFPIRPIVSTIGTFNYDTAGYLGNILEENFNAPIINQVIETLGPNNEWKPNKKSFKYVIKDSFDFINKISLIKLEKDDFMISIDVESLFTNVPIDETIEIVKNAFFKKKSQNIIKLMNIVGAKRQKNITTQGNIRNGTSEYEGDLNGLPWEHFEFLLRNVLQESIFMFNNKLYKQIDGASMGNKVAPIISNIFMDHFECKHMDELIKLGVKLWWRYVDDTFIIIKNKELADKILEFLNKQHDTIKFTMEKETNDIINFLDVKIKRGSENSISTSTYRKPTFTGVMLNWNSLTSIKYKKGLIRCLLDRSNKICSSIEQKIIEMEEIRNILLKNNYPSHIINKEYEKYEKYKQLNVDKITNPEEKIKYISLPYINDKSEIIARKIQESVEDHFQNVKLRVAFKSPATLGSHFPFKDKITDPTKLSNVIYHLKCKNCPADYIGMSKRIWSHRREEHEKTDHSSHVFEHHHLEGHEIDFDNVEIIDRADSLRKLEYKEMLYIRKLKPQLNKQIESELFTLIIRNVQLENSITRDFQKNLNKNNNKQQPKQK